MCGRQKMRIKDPLNYSVLSHVVHDSWYICFRLGNPKRSEKSFRELSRGPLESRIVRVQIASHRILKQENKNKYKEESFIQSPSFWAKNSYKHHGIYNDRFKNFKVKIARSSIPLDHFDTCECKKHAWSNVIRRYVWVPIILTMQAIKL